MSCIGDGYTVSSMLDGMTDLTNFCQELGLSSRFPDYNTVSQKEVVDMEVVDYVKTTWSSK